MLKITKCGANWCKPCHQLDKVMDEILPSYDTNITYVKVDVEEDIDFAEEYQIRGVPTMLFEKDGLIVEKIVGLRSGNEIKAIIDKYIKQNFWFHNDNSLNENRSTLWRILLLFL